jgi:carbonic anhydrase/acetyltransferase-like protein (isoleucine patch superfamily)
MGSLYEFRGRTPVIAATVRLFESAEITGDVTVGEDSIIGAGVKIIGDSHGPIRIGARVQVTGEHRCSRAGNWRTCR